MSARRLLARVWESETSIVSNVGKTYLRLAPEYTARAMDVPWFMGNLKLWL
jgi:hypothetical protein